MPSTLKPQGPPGFSLSKTRRSNYLINTESEYFIHRDPLGYAAAGLAADLKYPNRKSSVDFES